MPYRLTINDYLEKIAAKKKQTTIGWSPEVERERELIKAVQENDDFMAMKELLKAYQGTINKSIKKARLTSVMDYGTAQAEGVRAFKDLVKTFDLNQKNKPITYFYGTLPQVLNKSRYNNRDLAARKSEDLTMKSENKATAESFLSRMDIENPTSDQTLKFIKTNLRGGKSITKENLDRINSYERRELSGNQQIGGKENTDGAEFITLNDITNIEDETPEQLLDRQYKQQQIEEYISKLNKNERRLLMSLYGLGPFKGKKAKSINEARLNANMSYYDANKVRNDFIAKLKQQNLL